jgi:hypothetical protein
MALPATHRFRDQIIRMKTTSVGGTPVACYGRVPFRGTVTLVAAIVEGTITTADCTVAFALNGVANTAGNLTIPVAGAATPQTAKAVPSALIYVFEDDLITLTPSGASGASIPCNFEVVIRDTQ